MGDETAVGGETAMGDETAMGGETAMGDETAKGGETALYPLHPSIVKVWRIKSGLFSLIPVAGAVIYDIINLFDDEKVLPFGVLTLLFIVVLGSIVWFLPALRYRFWRYALTGEELFLVRGVFNRVRTIVPLRRIQHLDVSQDVFEREYELGKLIVHTAGTRSSDVTLPGLAIDVAENLRDTMKTFIIDEAL